MSTINDGGPAFPVRIPTGGLHANGTPEPTQIHPGMSLRDYFAAHAPSMPRDWFAPDVQVVKEIWQTAGGSPAISSANPSHRDEYGQPIPNVLTNADEVKKSWLEYQYQFEIQWPWVWADTMLAQRAKPPRP